MGIGKVINSLIRPLGVRLERLPSSHIKVEPAAELAIPVTLTEPSVAVTPPPEPAPAPEPEPSPTLHKTWDVSQAYEWNFSVFWMNSEQSGFKEAMASFQSGELKISTGYANGLYVREFFNSDLSEWQSFVEFVTGKRCLEIGPSVLGEIISWDVAAERYIVEPLLDKIESWQKAHYGFSVYENLTNFCQPAEELIDQLVGKIDGAIVCRNCIDHTPNWAFILLNIAQYAAPGCRLLFWTDLDHFGQEDDGHYNITNDLNAFQRLVEQLGFRILRTYQDVDRETLNYGCFAVKL